MSDERVADRIKKIKEYNSKTDCTPLYFYRLGKVVEIDKNKLRYNKDKTPNTVDLVRVILLVSQEAGSFNPKTSRLETPSGRNRSAIDIWRHAISMFPDVSVFKVMEALYTLCERGEVFGQFCRQIKRAVFRSHNLKTTNMSFHCLEYNIMFSSWEKLH